MSEWLGRRAVALSGLTPGSGTADPRPFADALAGVWVIGLGEATHGSRELSLLQHRLLEFLVTELGFTVLAMEAGVAAAAAVDAYARHGEGDPAAALRGLGVLDPAHRRAAGRAPAGCATTTAPRRPRRVSFAGIDPPYPAASLAALRAGTGQAEAALLAGAEARVAVWAHNGHVTTGRHSAGTIRAMDSYLRNRHGDTYYAPAAPFGRGEFLARRSRFGRTRLDRPPVVHRIPFAANELLVEATVEAAHAGPFLVDLRDPTPPDPVAAWLQRQSYLRGFGAVVGRFTHKTAFTATVLAEAFDGIAYLPEVVGSTPLG